jgi:hypothetical protein
MDNLLRPHILARVVYIQIKGTAVLQSTEAVRKATGAGLKAAVHRATPLSRAGVLERMFTLAFSKLVDIADSYFAWQAFGRRYAPGPKCLARPRPRSLARGSHRAF